MDIGNILELIKELVFMYKIYKLILNDEIVYIGRTKLTLKQRKSCGYKGCCVEKIYKECSIELIEETDDVSRERYWIKYYIELGYNLLNIEKGDGLNIKEYDREYQISNKDKIREYKKQYNKEYRKINKLKVFNYSKDYYSINRDKILEKKKEYRELNKNKNKKE